MIQLVLPVNALGVYHKHSDYVVFCCPLCGKRNKQCVIEARYRTAEMAYGYTCNKCCAQVEVKRPLGFAGAGEWLFTGGAK